MSSSITFFENLMSPQKSVRESAEKQLEQLKALPVQESLKVFSEAMLSTNESIFQLSVLMLKKIYIDNKEKKESLKPEEISQIINVLKSSMNFQKPWKSIQRICDALAPLYKLSSLPNGLKEIITLFQDEKSAISRKVAIYLIEVLCDLEALTDNVLDDSAINNFLEIFTKGLTDSDIDVKVSSLKAATQFLSNLQNEQLIMKFIALCDKMLETLICALKHDKENSEGQSGKTALETMTYIIDRHGKFWKGKTELIIDIVCQIAKEKTFTNSTRECALELVYSLVKNNPKSMKKSANFVNLFLPTLFELLLEIDNADNVEAWEKQIAEDEADKDEMYYGVRDGFERLSLDLGGKYFMETTAPSIKKLITSQNWIEVQAGFTALAYMSEGCKDMFKAKLNDLMGYVSNGLIHPHQRVRYTALFAFGAILKDTAPKPQIQFTNNILPALAQLMSDQEKSVRVKTESCSALVEFLRGLLNENKDEEESLKIISPYANDLVKLCSTLFEQSLQLNYAPLQEETLTCISLLSNLLEKEFAPYYDTIMPGLKKLFFNFNAQTPDQKSLKANCIDTIANICSSVSENADKYMADFEEITKAFAVALSNLPEEDPQLAAILNSYSYLSIPMKEKFIPVLNNLIPFLTKYINADIGLKLEDADLTEYIPEDEPADGEKAKVGSVVLNCGTQNAKLSLHTFALQNKILAFSTLNEIASNMKENFAPYIETLLKFAKDLLRFPYSRKIRKISIKAIASCIAACKTEEEKAKVLEYIGDSLTVAFSHNIKSRYLREVKSYLKYLTTITAGIESKTTYSENFIRKMYECFNECIKFIDAQKENVIAKSLNNTEEDEDEDLLAEDFDNLNEVARRIMEVSGNLFKLFREPLTATVAQSLYDSFLNSWKNALGRTVLKSDQEIVSSVCFFDDFMQYSDITAFNMIFPTFIDLSPKYQSDNWDLKQSIIYGYGIICERCDKESFNQVKVSILTPISNLIGAENNDDSKIAIDNAVGALGKFIYYQLNSSDSFAEQLVEKFINLLPLKNDLEESKEVSKVFFQQVLAQTPNPLLLNDKTINLVKEALKRTKELNDNEHYLEEQEVNLREACAKLGI